MPNQDLERSVAAGAPIFGPNRKKPNMHLRPILLFLLLLGLSSIYSQALTPDEHKALDAIVENQVTTEEPGLVAGVVRNGEIVYTAYRGLANLSHQIPVDEKSRINVASVAKQFTALTVLQLELEGKLSLDEDMRKYFPEFYSDIAEPILIRQMLTHSSGIRDVYELLGVKQDLWWRKEGFDNEEAIEFLSQQEELNFTPGSDYEYSNSNYILLTKIVEIASGKSFHDYSEEIFRKLGMENTKFLKNYMHVIPQLARPYTDWGNGIWQEYPMMTNLYGDGFLYTTLPDQLAFEAAIQTAMADNNVLLQKSQETIPGAAIKTYGFGLDLEETNGYPSVRHAGSTGAYNAQVIRIPEKKTSVFVMSNNGTIWSGNIAEAILEAVLPTPQVAEGEKFPVKPSVIPTATSLDEIIGLYETEDGRIVKMTEKEGELYWQEGNNNPRLLEREEGNMFRWDLYPNFKVAVFVEAAGQPVMESYYPGTEPRSRTKLPSFIPTRDYLSGFVGKYHSSELETSFSLSLDEDNQIIIHRDNRKDRVIEVIYEDRLLLFDKRITVKRDFYGRVDDLLVTTSRNRNVRFKKAEDYSYHPEITTPDGGRISVATTKADYGKGKGDILLTKNYPNGNEEWFTTFGGRSYDRAASVIETPDGGYLIVGSTSSYGVGNYDIYLIKTNELGKEEWSKAYGEALNDYGYTAEIGPEGSYIIKGTQQRCVSEDFSDCQDIPWLIEVNETGDLIREELQSGK